MLKTISLSY